MKQAEDPHAAVGAFVLHALPPCEAAAYENHLAGCADCRRDVADLSETTAELGLAEHRLPPPELKQRVLDRIAVTDQSPLPPAPAPARTWRTNPLRWALAACVAAAAALGGIAVWQYQRADDLQTQAEQRAERYSSLAEVLAAPDATIRTQELEGGATASVVTSREQSQAAFIASGLAPLGSGQVYQLWFNDAGSPRAAGLLAGRGGEQGRVLEGPVGDATAVGITVEPAGGSPQPTTAPLGVFELPT